MKLFPNFTRHHLITHTNIQLYACVLLNVASYDNYMLIYSYLTFCFFAFFYDNLTAIRCIRYIIYKVKPVCPSGLAEGPGYYARKTVQWGKRRRLAQTRFNSQATLSRLLDCV